MDKVFGFLTWLLVAIFIAMLLGYMAMRIFAALLIVAFWLGCFCVMVFVIYKLILVVARIAIGD